MSDQVPQSDPNLPKNYNDELRDAGSPEELVRSINRSLTSNAAKGRELVDYMWAQNEMNLALVTTLTAFAENDPEAKRTALTALVETLRKQYVATNYILHAVLTGNRARTSEPVEVADGTE